MIDRVKVSQICMSRVEGSVSMTGHCGAFSFAEDSQMNRQSIKFAGMLGPAEPRGRDLNHPASVLPPLLND